MSVLDDRRQALHRKTQQKFARLSLQSVGKLSTMFVRQQDCHTGPFNAFWRKFEHETHFCEICAKTAERRPEGPCVSVGRELKQQARDDPNFISSNITGDETWVYGYDPETKQQSSQWKSTNSPRPKKARRIRSSVKSMLIFFLTFKALSSRNSNPLVKASMASFAVRL